MEKEAEVFGPRTISGFLSQVGAEEAMTADQVVWSEQSDYIYLTKVTMQHAGATWSGVLLISETILMELWIQLSRY